MVEEVEFIDAESYSGSNEKVTFREIVLAHLKKIGGLACKEWRGGYTQKRLKMAGTMGSFVEEVYIPDSREEYSNAVDFLADIEFPYYDKEMKEALESLDKELNNALSEFGSNKLSESQIGEYRDLKVENRRRLFRFLNSFLFRINYHEGASAEESI